LFGSVVVVEFHRSSSLEPGSAWFFWLLYLSEPLEETLKKAKQTRERRQATKQQSKHHHHLFPPLRSIIIIIILNRNHSIPRIRMGYSVIHYTVTCNTYMELRTYNIIEAVN
jgi:hypothetical protein